MSYEPTLKDVFPAEAAEIVLSRAKEVREVAGMIHFSDNTEHLERKLNRLLDAMDYLLEVAQWRQEQERQRQLKELSKSDQIP